MDKECVSFFRKILTTDAVSGYPNLMSESVDQWSSLAKHILRERWDEASFTSARMRGVCLATLGMIKGEIGTQGWWPCVMDSVSEPLESRFQAVFEDLEDEEKRIEIEELLTAQGLPLDTLDKFKARLNERSWADRLADLRSARLGRLLRRLDSSMSIGFHGYWGGFHAAFNSHFKTFQEPLDKSELGVLEAHLDRVEGEINRRLLLAYSGYVQADQSFIRSTCLETLNWLEGELDWLARLCASASVSLQDSLEAGKVSPRQLGWSAIRAGSVARRWACLAAIALYSVRISILPDSSPEVTDRFSEAQRLPFNSIIDDGKNVTVQQLARKPNEHSNEYVEVEGFVRDTGTSTTGDGKFLSHFSLVSPSGEPSIQVVAIFEHMKHVGIVDGAYVKVNGDWKTDSPLADEPIVQVKRLQLAKLSEQSWLDSMLVNIEPWFEFYPNSHFIVWSLRPENKGEDGQNSPNTGASELVFKKKLGVRRDV